MNSQWYFQFRSNTTGYILAILLSLFVTIYFNTEKNLVKLAAIYWIIYLISGCVCICTIYWVDQKISMGFSIRCHGKTRTNYSANPIYNTMHVCINSRTANSYLCEEKKNYYTESRICVQFFFCLAFQCIVNVFQRYIAIPRNLVNSCLPLPLQCGNIIHS